MMETSTAAAGESVSPDLLFCVVLCSVELWSLIRHAICSASVCNLHEVLGVDVAAPLPEKLPFLVFRAVVCDVALLFHPTVGNRR